ncbi:MAG: hypothetical protein HKM03_11975 [Steroidobacteraceae bacterium]|nr:hypothetical protein [Steroidobacteraceae bacterium]
MKTTRMSLTAGLLASAAIALCGAAQASQVAPAGASQPAPAGGCACAPGAMHRWAGGGPRRWGGPPRWGHPPRWGWRGRPGPRMWMRVLHLSASQRHAARGVLRQAHRQLRALHVRMRANSRQLQHMMPDDPHYAAQVASISRENGALLSRSIERRAAARSRLYALLTPVQKARLAKMKARMAAARGRACPGRAFSPSPR